MRFGRTLIGVLAGAVLVGGVGVSAFAASGLVSIQVNQQPVSFFFNGLDKTPANGIFDNQGSNVPDAFIYDGTTYVPIRLVGDIFGQPVSWNGSKHAVILGRVENTNPLGAPYNCSQNAYGSMCSTPNQVTMANQPYPNATQLYVNGGATVANFNLDSEYSTFTFTVGLDDSSNNAATTVTILGDGNQLWSNTFNPGDLPKTATISVSGVNQLTVQAGANGGISEVDFVNTNLQP